MECLGRVTDDIQIKKCTLPFMKEITRVHDLWEVKFCDVEQEKDPVPVGYGSILVYQVTEDNIRAEKPYTVIGVSAYATLDRGADTSIADDFIKTALKHPTTELLFDPATPKWLRKKIVSYIQRRTEHI